MMDESFYFPIIYISLALITYRFLKNIGFSQPPKRITIKNLNNPYLIKRRPKISKSHPEKAPIGQSLMDGKIISLDQAKRTSHSLILGSTGCGKTTLMKQLLKHAIFHKQPAIVIDPKGDAGTIEDVKAHLQRIRKRPERIKGF